MKKISILLLATSVMSTNVWGDPVKMMDLGENPTVQTFEQKLGSDITNALKKHYHLKKEHERWDSAYSRFTETVKTNVSDAGVDKWMKMVLEGKLDCEDQESMKILINEDKITKKAQSATEAYYKQSQAVSELRKSGKLHLDVQNAFEKLLAAQQKSQKPKHNFDKTKVMIELHSTLIDEYQEQLQALEQGKKDGKISAEEFKTESAKLNESIKLSKVVLDGLSSKKTPLYDKPKQPEDSQKKFEDSKHKKTPSNDPSDKDQQAINGFVRDIQKHFTPILPSVTSEEWLEVFFLGKGSEVVSEKILTDVSKSLPNIMGAVKEFEKWHDSELEKLHALNDNARVNGTWDEVNKASEKFNQAAVEQLFSTFTKVNSEHPEEWVKIDGVLVNILQDAKEFKAPIKVFLDSEVAELSTELNSMSAEKKAQKLKEVESKMGIVSAYISVVRLPKTKALLVSEFDFLFDYVSQLGGDKAKQVLLASCGVQSKIAGMKTYGEIDAYKSTAETELMKLEEEVKNGKSTAEQSAKIQKLKETLEEIQESKATEIAKEASRGAESTKTLAEVSSSVITQTASVVATQAASIVADRMMEAAAGIASGSEDSSMKFGPWAQGFGSLAKQTANMRNTNAYDLSNIGFLIGCDIEISEKASAGAAFIYSRANVQFYKGDVLNEQANVFNNLGGMVYGQFMPTDNVSIDAQGSFILNKMTLEKGSEKTAKIGFAGVNAKYYLPVGSFMIIPKIGFNGLMGSFDADAAGSKDKDSKLNGEVSKMAGSLGLGFQRTFVTESEMKITPELHIGADYMFTGNARNMDNSIAIKGYESELKLLEMADRSALNVGVSLNVKKTESFDVTAGIDASATATHLGAKLGLESLEKSKIDGDFYSVGGYLKIKLSL
jgi:outer membrane autotransporter protein